MNLMNPADEYTPVQLCNDPPGFTMRSTGLWWQDLSDPEKPPLQLSGQFHVLAETRDVDGSAWGVLLEWKDHDGRTHRWALPRAMLAGDGADARRVLLDGGLYVAPGRKARELLNSYLAGVSVPSRARAVSRIGWHGPAFVLPDVTIGDEAGEQVLLQTNGTFEHSFRESGSLESWQENVARYAARNSRLILAIGAGLAAPLLDLLGAESGGIHFRGSSSTGKSTSLIVAGSVWGGGGVSGFVCSWRATSNGLEGVAAAHCDTLLCLDELGQVAAREAGEVAYMLSNGAGKSRAARDGSARKPQTWRTLFLSSGEISLADKVAEDGRGRKAAAGQQIRVIDVPADAGRGLGLFEELHGHPGADTFARSIKLAATQNYGTAGRRFVEMVAADPERIRAAARQIIDSFVMESVPADADGQVRRGAMRFALIAAAGEIATELSIVPWEPGEARRAAAKCFADWIAARGGIEPAEVTEGIAQVRRFLEQHGESRFSDIRAESERPTVNRAGFRRHDAFGSTEYFILPEVWRSEVTRGFDGGMLARVLIERGMMSAECGRLQNKVRLPGLGATRCFHVNASIFGVVEVASAPVGDQAIQHAWSGELEHFDHQFRTRACARGFCLSNQLQPGIARDPPSNIAPERVDAWPFLQIQ